MRHGQMAHIPLHPYVACPKMPAGENLLLDLQKDTFRYFVHQTNPSNGLVADSSRISRDVAQVLEVATQLANLGIRLINADQATAALFSATNRM